MSTIARLTAATALAGACLLGGCQNLVVGDAPPILRAGASNDDIQSAEYMARDLLTPQERAVLLARHSDEVEPQRTGPSGVATAAGAAGASLLGQTPLTPGGAGTTAAIEGTLRLLDGLTRSDRTPDRVTRINLPLEAFGPATPSGATAKALVRGYVTHQLEAFARRTGRSFACMDSCDGNIPTYRLSRSGPPLPYYDPDNLYVTLVLGRIVGAHIDPRRDQILGFSAEWGTPSPLDAVLCVSQDPPTKRGDSAVKPCNAQFVQPLERELLRYLTANGYITYANRWSFARVVGLRGRVFALAGSGRSGARLVEDEISPDTDRPFLPAVP